MSVRAFVILLALLGLLFVAGTAVGGCRDDRGGTEASWPDRLGTLLVRKEPLPRADLTAGSCLQGSVFVVRPGAACEAQIAASETHLRVCTLRVVSGEAEIELDPKGDDGAAVKRRLGAGDPALELQVFRSGALLRLRFRSGDDACRVRLE